MFVGLNTESSLKKNQNNEDISPSKAQTKSFPQKGINLPECSDAIKDNELLPEIPKGENKNDIIEESQSRNIQNNQSLIPNCSSNKTHSKEGISSTTTKTQSKTNLEIDDNSLFECSGNQNKQVPEKAKTENKSEMSEEIGFIEGKSDLDNIKSKKRTSLRIKSKEKELFSLSKEIKVSVNEKTKSPYKKSLNESEITKTNFCEKRNITAKNNNFNTRGITVESSQPKRIANSKKRASAARLSNESQIQAVENVSRSSTRKKNQMKKRDEIDKIVEIDVTNILQIKNKKQECDKDKTLVTEEISSPHKKTANECELSETNFIEKRNITANNNNLNAGVVEVSSPHSKRLASSKKRKSVVGLSDESQTKSNENIYSLPRSDGRMDNEIKKIIAKDVEIDISNKSKDNTARVCQKRKLSRFNDKKEYDESNTLKKKKEFDSVNENDHETKEAINCEHNINMDCTKKDLGAEKIKINPSEQRNIKVGTVRKATSNNNKNAYEHKGKKLLESGCENNVKNINNIIHSRSQIMVDEKKGNMTDCSIKKTYNITSSPTELINYKANHLPESNNSDQIDTKINAFPQKSLTSKITVLSSNIIFSDQNLKTHFELKNGKNNYEKVSDNDLKNDTPNDKTLQDKFPLLGPIDNKQQLKRDIKSIDIKKHLSLKSTNKTNQVNNMEGDKSGKGNIISLNKEWNTSLKRTYGFGETGFNEIKHRNNDQFKVVSPKQNTLWDEGINECSFIKNCSIDEIRSNNSENLTKSNSVIFFDSDKYETKNKDIVSEEKCKIQPESNKREISSSTTSVDIKVSTTQTNDHNVINEDTEEGNFPCSINFALSLYVSMSCIHIYV